MKIVKNYFIILCLIFLPSTILFCDESNDSTKVYYLKPIIITATRSEIMLEKTPAYSQIITREQISNLNPKTVADVLLYSEGIFIKDYGSAAGLKTISIKGTTSENNLILINGMRVNNFQNGLVDLSLLNPNTIEKIEIVYGGNTTLYGTDAVGGVINIITLKPAEKLEADLFLSKGSFDYNKLAISLSKAYKNIGSSFVFIREYGKDNYKFRLPVNNTLKERENTEFNRNNYYLSNYFKLNNFLIKTYSTYTHSDKNLPGSLSFPSTTSSQLDRNFYFQFLTKYQFTDKFYLEFNSGWNYFFQKYKDPIYSIASFSKNNQILFNPQVFYELAGGRSLMFGIEYAKGILKGTDYQSAVNRSQKSAFLTGMFLFDINKWYLQSISVFPSIRYEKFDNISSELSPKLGLNFGIIKGLHIKTSYSRNYRVPTLNELFYIDAWGNKGNPNLKPEYSNSFDGGFSYSFYFFGNVNLEYSYFNISTKDKIIWKEVEPWIYSPQNVDKVISRGSLISLNYRIKNYKLSVNYTLTDSRKISQYSDPTYNKKLIYSPENMWKFNLNGNYKFLNFGLSHIIVGKRYIDEQNINALPEYQLTNGNLGIKYNTNFGDIYMKFEINNIFDRSYQVIKDYPMPLRSYTLSFGLDY